MKALTLFACTLLAIATNLSAQAPATPEQRLREQLKQVMTQLRTAEAERTNLQTDKAALEAKVKTFEKQSEEITKQMAADKDAAKAEAEKLRAEIAAKEAEVTQTKDLLVKADTFGKQSAELARKTEAERAKLSSENIQLKRVVADQRMKNAKMFEIGTEILTRYSKFGLGTAITAREPFIGVTRARLESMVEDYSGQLAGQRIRLDGSSPKPAPAPTGERPADGTASSGKKRDGAKP
jgi:chromosome segregation ATPase